MYIHRTETRLAIDNRWGPVGWAQKLDFRLDKNLLIVHGRWLLFFRTAPRKVKLDRIKSVRVIDVTDSAYDSLGIYTPTNDYSRDYWAMLGLRRRKFRVYLDVANAPDVEVGAVYESKAQELADVLTHALGVPEIRPTAEEEEEEFKLRTAVESGERFYRGSTDRQRTLQGIPFLLVGLAPVAFVAYCLFEAIVSYVHFAR